MAENEKPTSGEKPSTVPASEGDEVQLVGGAKPRILLVDDEDQFRTSLAKRLAARGYDVIDVDNGEDAMRALRHQNPEVVVLDQKMPDMSGIETLRELKNINPDVQVIMLTGHGSVESARLTGKHDVYAYMQKPTPVEDLIEKIEDARQEHRYALRRSEAPHVEEKGFKAWFLGVEGMRPGFIIIGAILFLTMFFMPAPERLQLLLTTEKGGPQGELIL